MIDDKVFYKIQDLKTRIFFYSFKSIVISLPKTNMIFKQIRHLYWFFLQVKINITDDNERPVFSQAEYQKKVEENTKLEGVLMTVTAQDRKNEKLVECNCTYRLIGIINYILISK